MVERVSREDEMYITVILYDTEHLKHQRWRLVALLFGGLMDAIQGRSLLRKNRLLSVTFKPVD